MTVCRSLATNFGEPPKSAGDRRVALQKDEDEESFQDSAEAAASESIYEDGQTGICVSRIRTKEPP
jgi:hypothetical protein